MARTKTLNLLPPTIKRPRYGKAPVYRIVRADQRRRQHRRFRQIGRIFLRWYGAMEVGQ